MTDVSHLAAQVTKELKATSEYKEYYHLLDEIRRDPVLYAKVNELRKKNFVIQRQGAPEEMLELMDALTNEYEAVMNNELAAEFMAAEVELCRMVQEFTLYVATGLEFN